jgi:putative ABC transport system ATP-binding protein
VLVTHDSGIGARLPRVIHMRDGRLVDDVRRSHPVEVAAGAGSVG